MSKWQMGNEQGFRSSYVSYISHQTLRVFVHNP